MLILVLVVDEDNRNRELEVVASVDEGVGRTGGMRLVVDVLSIVEVVLVEEDDDEDEDEDEEDDVVDEGATVDDVITVECDCDTVDVATKAPALISYMPRWQNEE